VPEQQDWGSSVLRDLGIDPPDAPKPSAQGPTDDDTTSPVSPTDPRAPTQPPPAQASPSAPPVEPQRSAPPMPPAAQPPPSGSAAQPNATAARAQVAAPAPEPHLQPAASPRPSSAPAALPVPTAPGQRSPAAPPPTDPRPAAAPPAVLDPAALTRTRRHRDPLAQRATRAVGKVLGTGTSREVREAEANAERLQQPVTTVRRVAVLSMRGGAGKTTVATLLATALARGRNDRVLAVDAAPGLGSLALRAGASSSLSVAALGRAAAPPRNFEEAEPQLARAESGLWLLTGSADDAGALDPPTYQAAVAALSRFFAVLVTDCGPDASSALNREILADAHALALVTPASVDGVVSAHGALGWLRRTPAAALAARTVVVLTNHSPHADGVDLKRGARTLASQGVRVARFPYDRSLAAGARIQPRLLGERTRLATLRLAADLLSFAAGQRGDR
jgi:MinD-like ATPase involved in chromosome partitioning or flagellar assembly